MQKIYILILAGIFPLILVSCELADKPADGPEDEIVVVADSLEYQALKSSLETTFEKTIYTPQPEKLFSLKPITPDEIERYRNSKNIIIIAPYRSGSKTSRLISAVIDTSVKNKIINSGENFIKRNDMWAKDQLVMFLTAPTANDLDSAIMRKKGQLVCAFQKASDKRLISSLYDPRFEKRDAEGKLLKDYGWTIYIPRDYRIEQEDPSSEFVWIRNSPQNDVERWIFVHWIDNAAPDYLNSDSVNAVRNRVTNRFYGSGKNLNSIKIAANYYTSSEINFKGRYAILTQGLWENKEKHTSGPFINYTFYDEKTRRIYMVDGAVYTSPKYYKRNLIQQVDVTLQSFLTENEVSPDKKKLLLEAAKDYKITKK
jgi:hypothetical protein